MRVHLHDYIIVIHDTIQLLEQLRKDFDTENCNMDRPYIGYYINGIPNKIDWVELRELTTNTEVDRLIHRLSLILYTLNKE